MEKKSTILITGGSGLIGTELKQLLIDSGYKNVLSPSHQQLDCTNQKNIVEYFTSHQPEYVFHLAAKVGGIKANQSLPANFIYENTIMQTLILHACQQYQVKKCLLPGSACTYPVNAEQPIKESALFAGPIEVTNIAYGTAKLNGIIMAQSFSKQYDLKVIIPMPTNTYGQTNKHDVENAHVIPALIKRFQDAKKNKDKTLAIWGSGNITREFIHAKDVARAFLFLMNNYDKSDIINVGTQEEMSIMALANLIAKTIGFKGKILTNTDMPDGAIRKCLDSTKLFDLGWKPQITLSDGISQLINEEQ